MRNFKLIGRVLAIVGLLVSSLGVDAQHYVPIDGYVSTPLTLNKMGGDSVYLVNEAVLVGQGGDLTIESGVKIYFDQSAYLRVDGGRLHLEGRDNDSIYLLCYEFSHDWAGIQLKNVVGQDAVSLSYVVAVGASPAVVATNCGDVVIKHCTLNNYYAGKGMEFTDCHDLLVDSCFFSQCVTGIELKAVSGDSYDNLFSHNIFDQGQINVSVSNVNYGRKCRDNYISDNCFQDAATAIYFESIGGLLYSEGKNYILNNLISSSLPDGNTNYSSYGIKAAMDSLIIQNNIFWRNDEAVCMLRNCHLVFEHNTFYENGMTLSNLLPMGTLSMVGNVVSEAQRPIAEFASGQAHLNGNHFIHYKAGNPLFVNASSEDVDMRGNFWQTTDPDIIESLVYDAHDNPQLGEIQYDGFLTECDTTIPVSPPFRVKKQLINNRWYISWDENPEADVSKYILFYGDFNYYKFAYHSLPIEGCSYTMPSQSVENVAVAAVENEFDFDVYASKHQSAYAFAAYYPYAGPDADLCAPDSGYIIRDANIPYTYNGFVWQTSGTGSFSDPLSLRPIYYASKADFDAGEVTLTLRVINDGVVRTDEMKLVLFKQLGVFAGNDGYGDVNSPIVLDQAEAYNYDSLLWHSLGDGWFDDDRLLNTVYHLGNQDVEQANVVLMLEAWSHCGHVTDTVRFDLYETFSLEGNTWFEGAKRSGIQVVAASLHNRYPAISGFYRTVSDSTGHFSFSSLLADTYILYAFPDTINREMGGAYYLGDLQWHESNMIFVDGNVYDVDITLPSLVADFPEGEGQITGIFEYPNMPFVAADFYCSPWLGEYNEADYCNGGLSNVGVLLLNANGQRLLGFALTDANGSFRFANLPFGTYQVMADVPRYGRGICESVSLSPEHPLVSDLHLYIDDSGKVAMMNWNETSEYNALGVYPNPAVDEIVVDGLDSYGPFYVTLINVCGSVVKSGVLTPVDRFGQVVISIEDLPGGLYFLQVVGESGTCFAKFVKQ